MSLARTHSATVLLALPQDYAQTYARCLRLMVSQSLLEMARSSATPAAPVLYLVDEFAAGGHRASMERALADPSSDQTAVHDGVAVEPISMSDKAL